MADASTAVRTPAPILPDGYPRPLSRPASILGGLVECARLYAERPALTGQQDDYTHAQLARVVCRIAEKLRTAQVEAGDRVAVRVSGATQQLILTYGIAAVQGVIVPVSKRTALVDVNRQLADAGCSLLISDDDDQGMYEVGSTLHLDELDWRGGPSDADMDLVMRQLSRAADQVVWEAPLFIIYTSGTTARPKGVVISHRSRMLWSLHLRSALRMDQTQVFLSAMPVTHSAGITLPLAHLYSGALVGLLDRFDVGDCTRALQETGADRLLLVPTMLARLMRHEPFVAGNHALREIICCGSRLSPEVREELARRMADVQLYEYYGSTESPCMTIRHPDDPEEVADSVGRPFRGVQVEVRDSSGRPVETGEVGEVWANNVALMSGYWRNPEETALAVPDGWYRTNDFGYLDADNYLFLRGRADDAIVTGGLNVPAWEVERALCEDPRVEEAFVSGVPDPEWGEVVAAIIAAAGELDHDEVLSGCRARLPGYKVPKLVLRVDALPRNTAGKIDKREARELLARAKGAD